MHTESSVIPVDLLPQRLAALAALIQPDAAHRSRVLTDLASALEASRDQILEIASEETALTVDELTPEFTRMTATLRLFAQRILDPATFRVQHDSPAPPLIGPAHDLRSRLIPLGLVAVFGASNFPLAYGVCGGDTASALAAGCPVTVKEHPAHPRTGQALARIAHRAGVPLLYVLDNGPDNAVATALITHPLVRAVGFTGSTAAGLAIDALARSRVHPLGHPDAIPVFAEMGSCNVIVIRAHALAQRADQIARDLATSLLARHGQQCTAPGVIICEERADTDHTQVFARAWSKLLQAAPARRLLSPRVASGFFTALDDALALPGARALTSVPSPAQRALHTTPAVAVQVPWRASSHPHAWQEIFGPAALVTGATMSDMLSSPWLFPPSLTATLIADDADHDAHWPTLISRAVAAAGRVIFNGVPTGVRVADAMNHTGPHPACNAPHTTAVGPRALERWCRPVTLQNAPSSIAL